jgi:hypothetical protein
MGKISAPYPCSIYCMDTMEGRRLSQYWSFDGMSVISCFLALVFVVIDLADIFKLMK